MAKQQPAEEWKILSDSELVARARRMTMLGLLILVVVVGGLSYLLANSPVAEPGGPSRPVRLPTAGGKAPPTPETTSAASAAPAAAQLPPNPWLRRPPAGKPAEPPARPAQGGGRFEM